MFEIISIFVLIFSGFSIGNRIRTFSDMKLNPPSFFPVEITFEIDTKLPGGPIKINLIIKNSTNFLKLAIINLNSTNPGGKINHLTPKLNQIITSFLNLEYSKFPLSNQHNNRNSRLIASKTNSNMCIIWIH